MVDLYATSYGPTLPMMAKTGLLRLQEEQGIAGGTTLAINFCFVIT